MRDPDADAGRHPGALPFLDAAPRVLGVRHHAQPTTAAEIAMGGVRSLDANRNARWRNGTCRASRRN